MNAERMAKSLGGHRSGAGWLARCPAHDDQSPSLSIKDGELGRLLLFCFAGCETLHVIARLKARGLWEETREHSPGKPTVQILHAPHDGALKLWREATPASDTVVQQYLRNRGVSMSVPDTLRFHRGLGHRSGTSHPAMIALVTHAITGAPMAIHRTYLDQAGGKAQVEPNKMMLGRTAGGIVRLGENETGLMVGEGIETVLSAMQATRRPGWASLSTAGLKSLELPAHVQEITILADGDAAGRDAARTAANKWSAKGVRVRIATAPEGRDFNDLNQALSSNKGTSSK